MYFIVLYSSYLFFSKVYTFVLPDIPDLASINVIDVKVLLPYPKVNGKIARQQSFFVIEIDLRRYNIF